MCLPQLSSCCCGCTLRTGTLIILWMYLVLGILSIALLPWAKEMQSNSATNDSKLGTTTQTPNSIHVAAPGIADIIMGVISIFASGVGLYGTYKELHLYLTPFLAWEMVNVIIQAVLQLIAYCSVVVIIGDIIGFLIFFYLWLVVFSYYRVLKGSIQQIEA